MKKRMGQYHSYVWPVYFWNIDPILFPMIGMFMGLFSWNMITLHLQIVIMMALPILNYLYALRYHLFNMFGTLDFMHGRNWTCYDEYGKVPAHLSAFTADDVATVFILYISMIACAWSFYAFRKYVIKLYYWNSERLETTKPSFWSKEVKNSDYEWSFSPLGLAVSSVGSLVFVTVYCLAHQLCAILANGVAFSLGVDCVLVVVFFVMFGLVVIFADRGFQNAWKYWPAMTKAADPQSWMVVWRIVAMLVAAFIVWLLYNGVYAVNIYVPVSTNGVQTHWCILAISLVHAAISFVAAAVYYWSEEFGGATGYHRSYDDELAVQSKPN